MSTIPLLERPQGRAGNGITCANCKKPLRPKRGSRRMRFCSVACRQSAFRARKWTSRYEGPLPLRSVRKTTTRSRTWNGDLGDRGSGIRGPMEVVSRELFKARLAARRVTRWRPVEIAQEYLTLNPLSTNGRQRRSMSRRQEKGRLPPFVPLILSTIDSPAWKALSHGARSLYVALRRRYSQNVHNNGRIYLSQRVAAKEIGSHHNEIARWFRELQFYGFIVMTKGGSLRRRRQGESSSLATY